MKAAVFKGKDFPLTVTERPKPKVGKGDVLIKLKSASINHHELWSLQEESYPSDKNGLIMGADGSGVIEEAGSEIDDDLIGKEVVINPSMHWGGNPIVQSDSYKILGDPDQGTFAEYISVSKNYIAQKPLHLTFDEAAAIPLSGLTAYRALFTKAKLQADENVLITGIGGGAALWALQLAVAQGGRVSVTSSSEEKLHKSKKLGALAAYNYKESDWASRAHKDSNGFDVIIDSSGGDGFGQFVDLASPGARIVNFGRTAGSIANFNIRKFFWKQLTLFGSTMGTPDEFLSLLKFIENKKIKPVIDHVYPLEKIVDAFDRMKNGNQFGKIILKIS
jgi:zinc-binding alcohol dehydrogenase/oxidoreductase